MVFGQEYLLLQDLATIFLIRDNAGKRPVFFSWSDGGYPDQTLGLSAYLVSQGLVRKLMPRPVEPTDSIVLSQGLGYLDLPRTRRSSGRRIIGSRRRGNGPAGGWTCPRLPSCSSIRSCTGGRRTCCGKQETRWPPPARTRSRGRSVRTSGASSVDVQWGGGGHPAAPGVSGPDCARHDSQVNGQPSPNGGSGCPGRPIRSCRISCRTTSSCRRYALAM